MYAERCTQQQERKEEGKVLATEAILKLSEKKQDKKPQQN